MAPHYDIAANWANTTHMLTHITLRHILAAVIDVGYVGWQHDGAFAGVVGEALLVVIAITPAPVIITPLISWLMAGAVGYVAGCYGYMMARAIRRADTASWLLPRQATPGCAIIHSCAA